MKRKVELSDLSLKDGIISGLLHLSEPPSVGVEVLVSGKVVGHAICEPSTEHAGEYHLTADLPVEALTDGIQIVKFRFSDREDLLGHFSILAGEEVDTDILAEVALLRQELELLKRAFRAQNAVSRF